MTTLEYFGGLSSAPISKTSALVSCLEPVWYEFDGWEETELYKSKLERMENATWNPPELRFDLERHRDTMRGSSYATVYSYVVNIEEKTVFRVVDSRRKQVRKPAPRVDVKKLALEIAQKIENGEPDERIKWIDSSTVHVVLTKVFPKYSAANWTIDTRKAEMQRIFPGILGTTWEPIGENKYRKRS